MGNGIGMVFAPEGKEKGYEGFQAIEELTEINFLIMISSTILTTVHHQID